MDDDQTKTQREKRKERTFLGGLFTYIENDRGESVEKSVWANTKKSREFIVGWFQLKG